MREKPLWGCGDGRKCSLRDFHTRRLRIWPLSWWGRSLKSLTRADSQQKREHHSSLGGQILHLVSRAPPQSQYRRVHRRAKGCSSLPCLPSHSVRRKTLGWGGLRLSHLFDRIIETRTAHHVGHGPGQEPGQWLARRHQASCLQPPGPAGLGKSSEKSCSGKSLCSWVLMRLRT